MNLIDIIRSIGAGKIPPQVLASLGDTPDDGTDENGDTSVQLPYMGGPAPTSAQTPPFLPGPPPARSGSVSLPPTPQPPAAPAGMRGKIMSMIQDATAVASQPNEFGGGPKDTLRAFSQGMAGPQARALHNLQAQRQYALDEQSRLKTEADIANKQEDTASKVQEREIIGEARQQQAATANVPHKGQQRIDTDWAKAHPLPIAPDANGEYWVSDKFAEELAKEVSKAPPDDTAVVSGNLVNKRTGQVIFSAPEKPEKPVPGPNTETELAIAAENPDQKISAPAVAALKRLAEQKKAERVQVSVGVQGGTASDPHDIAQGIMNGDQPPTLQGLYRYGAPVRAELARKGYDLATAQRDWEAVKRHLSTLNGQQQERLRQAITFTHDSLDVIDGLYGQWLKAGPASGFKVLNRAALAAAKNVPGETGAIAQNLEAQINDLISELGTVYKGGTASTDESLRLAAENLKADWNEQTFKRAMGMIRKNLTIRKNSILTSEPVGVSPNSPYLPQHGGGAPNVPSAPNQPKIRVRLKSNGVTGTVDASDFDQEIFERL